MNRFIVTEPVAGGYQFWDVVDTGVPGNFVVATFSVRISCAKGEARYLCSVLNQEENDKNGADGAEGGL